MNDKQQGVVLIISMVMLLILTLTSISGMQMTKLDEKMASNNFEQNIAFQATETALKKAEQWLDNNSNPVSNTNPSSSEVWIINKPQELTSNWTNNTVWASKGVQITGIANVIEQPYYFIEKLTTGVYRITAKGTGRIGDAQVILQSIYARN